MKRVQILFLAMIMMMAMLFSASTAETLYNITLTWTEGGRANADDYQPAVGQIIKLSATPDEDYDFIRWEVTGLTIPNSSINPLIFYMPSNDVKAKAIFAPHRNKESSSTSSSTDASVLKEKEATPEEPHVHAEVWVEGTPATCTHTGLTDGSKCKWCGEVMQAQKEIPKTDHVYTMWVPNGSGKHYASCLSCGYQIDAECQMVELPIKSTSGATVTLCPVCGSCNGATATTVKGFKAGEGAPYRGTLRVWNIDTGDDNKYLAFSFDRFGKVMQPEGEVSVTLPDDLKGTTAGVIGTDGKVTSAQESNGTLKLDFTGSQVVVLMGN